MVITLIVLIGYLLPMALMWRYFYLAYSPRGIWCHTDVDALCLFLVLFPFVNIIAGISFWIDWPVTVNNKKVNIAHSIVTLGGYKEDKLKKH